MSFLRAFCLLFGLASAATAADLVVYSPNSDGLLKATIPAFEKKYGVKVEVISAGTGELFKRLQGEASSPYADVVFGGAYATYVANKALLQGEITPYAQDASVILVNKKLIGDVKATGYKDLLNPALKGKIVAANPTASSSGFCQLTNILNAMGKGNYESQEAWTFVKALFANCVVISNSSAVWKGVRDGEYTVGLTYEDPSVQLVRDGADVKVVYMKEGVVFLPAGSAIVKGAKNLANAQRFIDFIVSKPIQNAYGSSTTSRPVMKNAAMPPYMTKMKDIKVIKEDMAYVEANKAKIVAKFKDIYTDLK